MRDDELRMTNTKAKNAYASSISFLPLTLTLPKAGDFVNLPLPCPPKEDPPLAEWEEVSGRVMRMLVRVHTHVHTNLYLVSTKKMNFFLDKWSMIF